MQSATPEVSAEMLQALADAWNSHDVDALMSFMTQDCVFEASAGLDIYGARYSVTKAVQASCAELCAVFPDSHRGGVCHFFHANRGVSEGSETSATRR